MIKFDERAGAMLRVVTVVYFAIGAALILQPHRWSRTPAYGVLLSIFDAYVWGVIYLAVALLLAAALWMPVNRVVGIAAHTVAIAITATWLLAFCVRYFTDSATTIVNVASWATYLSIIVFSALHLDRHETTQVIVEP